MSLYSSLTQVLAPFAAKINGLLTGYDGTVYSTPGEAVRTQINDLHVLIGDTPGTAIQASAVAYNDSNVAAELANVNGRLTQHGTSIEEITDAIGDLSQLQTEDKTDLVSAINEAAQTDGSGSGLTAEVKEALLVCFRNVAWINDKGQDYYDSLEEALYPPTNITRITAVYTQVSPVYAYNTLDDLKSDLVVTAYYDDSTSAVINNYSLTGTLRVGTSNIVASYGGKTATFSVTVLPSPDYEQDILENASWVNGSYDAWGNKSLGGANWITEFDDADVQDQIYVAVTTLSFTYAKLLVWDSNNTYLGATDFIDKRLQLKPNNGFRYAIQINSSNFDETLITMKPVDNRSTQAKMFELSLADYVENDGGIVSNTFMFNISVGMHNNGITAGNYLDKINRMSIPGIIGYEASVFYVQNTFDKIGISTYNSNINCSIQPANIACTSENLELCKQYIIDNDIKLRINY